MLLLGIFLADNYKATANDGPPPIIGPTYVCPNQSFSFYTVEGVDPSSGEFYQWYIYNSSYSESQMQSPIQSDKGSPYVSLPYFIINPLPSGTYTLSFQVCNPVDGCTDYNFTTIQVGTTGVLPNIGQLCGDFLPSADGYNPAYPSFMAQTSYSAGTSTACNNSPTYYYSNSSGGNYTYIHSGVSIGMHAGASIFLNPGFTAENGAVFLASITTACPTGGNLRMADSFGSTLSQPQANTASTIYPNPSSGVFTISSDATIDAVEVSNSLGEVVLKDSKSQIDISNQSEGIYFVKISSNGQTVMKKVIKK